MSRDLPIGANSVVFTSDPKRSQARAATLNDYFDSNVLNGDQFVCKFAAECKASHPHNFTEGQLHHVGKHYDLNRNGKPFRVVICGQEYGQADHPHQTLEKRYQQVAIGSGQKKRFLATGDYSARNPHMKGTTSALRLLFDLGLGSNHTGEFFKVDGKNVHIFDAFALVNFLLCSATLGATKNGKSTPVMRRNCGRHFEAALTILQPTILICQGAGVANWLKTVFDVRNGRIQKGALHTEVLEFTHPSSQGNANNWGWNDHTPYLLSTIKPAIEAALSLTKSSAE